MQLDLLKENLYDLEQKRRAFKAVFKDTPDGPLVLSIIRNQLGANNYDAGKVIPELVVFDHWLQYMIGIKHEQNFMEETKALLTAINDDDIIALRKKIAEEKKNEEKDQI